MGKRELIIAAAFVVIAVVAYQLTAPPPKDGERGFSLSNVFSGIRREMRANSSNASIEKTGSIALRNGVTELRLSVNRAMPLTVVGEKRDDIGYVMTVESTGPDVATAKHYAEMVHIKDDDLGQAQRLEVDFPDEGQQNGQLKLIVPAQLLLRLESGGRLKVSGVRAVDLRNLVGEATLNDIKETVSGGHRNGELTVTQAGAIDLTLTTSRARFNEIAGTITVSARNGDCAVTQSKGAIDATVSNTELVITEPAGPVRVSGEGASLRVVMPAKDLTVDARRMLVETTIAAAIPATIVTSEEALRLILVGPPGVTIDAVGTNDASIIATDFGLEPKKADRESRFNAPLGGGGPRIALRNNHADIVIALRK